jgi:hypothetical protein
MDVQQDFKELLECLNANQVEYLIVGGYALAFYGAPRFTGDLDFFVRPTIENGSRILAALGQFGFGSLELTPEDFAVVDQVIQLGVAPVRIDLITSISGVSWDQAMANSVPGTYGDLDALYISKADFIANKRATGRHKDLADIEALGEIP